MSERIEIAIARHWPDVEAVCRDAGCTPRQVQEAVDRLEAIEHAPRREHDCSKHPAGSLQCHDDHNCWCPECKSAANRRLVAHQMNDDRCVELRAHSEYERLRKTGMRIKDMPTWVAKGQRSYDSQTQWVRRVRKEAS